MTISLLNRSPEPNETNVPVDVLIELDITNSGAGGVDDSLTQVYVEGQLAYNGGIFQTGFDGPSSASTSPFPHTRRIVIDPTTDFDSLQVVDVQVISESVGGTFTIDESYEFTIEDLTKPILLSASGISLKTVKAVFDEAIDPIAALDPTNYVIDRLQESAPSVTVEVVSVAQLTDSTFVVTTNIELTHGVAYQLTVENIEDPSGNVIEVPNNTVTFQSFTPPIPARRRFNLWRMLPRTNRDEDITQDLEKTIKVLQEVTDQLLFSIDAWTEILDPDVATEQFVDAMLDDMGNPFDFPLTLIDKRRLLRVLVEIYRQKGTAKGIKNVVRFFLGFEIDIYPFIDETGLILGESELGIDWELGIGDIRAAYTFVIELDFNPTEEQRNRLIRIADYMKPGHTHLGSIVEPEQPDIFDHWELGESELGENTFLH